MKEESEKIRAGLLEFWNDQLNMTVTENAVHIAYPLLMPDGWQVSFSIYRVDGPSEVYRMSDNGKTFKYLMDHHSLGKKSKEAISEKCTFFDVTFDRGKILKESSRIPLPVDIELFAESIQSIAYLVYREQDIPELHCAAKLNFARILEVEHIKVLDSGIVEGHIIKTIPVDYVVEGKSRIVCKIAEKTREINTFMELWGFRFNDIKNQSKETKTLMVYNHESCSWSDRNLAIGRNYCDMFIEYNRADEIKEFLKTA